VASISRTKYAFDFGFDLGGPIVQDKVWFYVGFAPHVRHHHHDVILRKRLANMDRGPMAADGYAGDLDPNVSCPRGSTRGSARTLPAATRCSGARSVQRVSSTSRSTSTTGSPAQLPGSSQQLADAAVHRQPPDANGAIDGTIGASAGPTFPAPTGSSWRSRFTNTHVVLGHFV